MSKKILSIIVPAYNMEKYLPKCLGSLIVTSELMPRLEVIVVNDGSKDRTKEIADDFVRKWPGTFKVITKVNGHYGSCINAALSIVEGKFVKILDADDWFETQNFANYIKWLTTLQFRYADEIDLILSDYDCINEKGQDTGKIRQGLPSGEILTLKELVMRKDITFMHGFTYRTEMVRSIGYRQTEGIAYTDSEWIFEPAAFAQTILYYPHVIYKYLFGREGQSVDPSVQKRCINQLEQVALSVLNRYETRKEILSVDGCAYMIKLALRQVRLAYEQFLYCVSLREGVVNIIRFDNLVQESSRDVSSRIQSWKIPNKVGIPWIVVMRRFRFLVCGIILFARCYRFLRCL